jgi:hypothetical protein
MNFGFRFQAGFVVRFPARQLAGPPGTLHVVVRVAPADGRRVYYQRLIEYRNVPPRTDYRPGVGGGWVLGEGDYRVDLAMIDSRERACRAHWKIHVRRSHAERRMPVDIAPETVENLQSIHLTPPRQDGSPRHLTVLLHVAPMNASSLALRVMDGIRLLDSLGSILRHAGYADVRVIAFNLDQQKILYRTDRLDEKSYAELENAMAELKLATVPWSVLRSVRGNIGLLVQLAREEETRQRRSEAVLFLGPAARTEEKLSASEREPLPGSPGLHYWYFELRPYWWRRAEFPDVIEHLVKGVGGHTFHIHSSAEFAAAMDALRGRPK